MIHSDVVDENASDSVSTNVIAMSLSDVNDDDIIDSKRNSIPVSPALVRQSSFWNRMFRLKSFNKATILRQRTVRLPTLPPRVFYVSKKDVHFTLLWFAFGWIFLAVNWGVFLIREPAAFREMPLKDESNGWQNSTNHTSSNGEKIFTEPRMSQSNPSTSARPTWSPTYYDFDLEGEGRDVIYEWAKLCSHGLFFIPLASTISLYIYTDLSSYNKGKPLAIKLTIIYLTQIVLAVPFAATRLLYNEHIWQLIAETAVFYLATILWWCSLVSLLSLDWRLNIYWLPALQLCCAVVFIISNLPILVDSTFLNRIVVYVPLVMSIIEHTIKKVLEHLFDSHRDNYAGLSLSMAYLIYPMEAIRFVSFILLWLENDIANIVLNVLFTILGEIYTHTQLHQFCKHEIEVRIYGRRFDDLLYVHSYYSSIRTFLEYVTPTFLVWGVILTYWCRDYIPMINSTYEFVYRNMYKDLMRDIWFISLVYYLIEFSSEILCWGIGKLSEYERVSAIGSFSWSMLITMIIYVGTQVEVPFTTSGILMVHTH